jgi:hypothetical protein
MGEKRFSLHFFLIPPVKQDYCQTRLRPTGFPCSGKYTKTAEFLHSAVFSTVEKVFEGLSGKKLTVY